MSSFTVASYNIRKCIGADRLRRPERTLAVLGEIGADIVALQEADRRFGARASALPEALLAEQSNYVPVPLNGRASSMGWHGNALLVRRGVEVVTHDLIALPTLEPRGAVLAEVRVQGVRLRIVGMHLDLSGLRRMRQARAIIEALERRRAMPTIIMGDLNEWRPLGGCIREFTRHFRIAPTEPSFHARRPVGKLDRIMFDHSLHCIESGTHRSLNARQASDHLPVWARIEPGHVRHLAG